jgi:hypothetical protein
MNKSYETGEIAIEDLFGMKTGDMEKEERASDTERGPEGKQHEYMWWTF